MGVTFIAKEGTYTAPAKLVTKEITENGTYNATDDSANGYSSVTVNVEGGGSSWQTVFEGSVTTEAGQDGTSVSVLNVNITADTIKVTFNGTEYTCNKQTYDIFGATFNDDLGEFDFTEYPFAIAYDSGLHIWNLITPSSGTYTLKIEEEQSGGSSDFSTATIIIDNIAENPASPEIYVPCVADPLWDGQITSNSTIDLEEFPITTKVIMYKGKARLYMPTVLSADATLEGNITRTVDDELAYYITGDCKITLNYED